MKEDRYEFDLQEWTIEDVTTTPMKLILTRKKPKVKVEYQSCGWSEWREPDGDYGEYHIVQFRVTGWDAEETFEHDSLGSSAGCWTRLDRIEEGTHYRPIYDGKHSLYIGLDARDKFSTPVLLPESVYKELDNITKALEQKANEVKG